MPPGLVITFPVAGAGINSVLTVSIGFYCSVNQYQLVLISINGRSDRGSVLQSISGVAPGL